MTQIQKLLTGNKKRVVVFVILAIVFLYLYYKTKKTGGVMVDPGSKIIDTGFSGGLGGLQGGQTGPDYEGATGDVTPKLYYQSMEWHADIRASGASEAWLLTDYGTEALPDGKIWRYGINAHIFHSATRLLNYPYPCDEPVRIWVTPVKIDKQNVTLVYWGAEEWQDANLSAGFSQNNSFGFSYRIFNKAAA